MKKLLPFLLLFSLLGVLGRELYSASPRQPTEAMVGDQLPAFRLPSMNNPKQTLTPSDFKGEIVLLNIWASWCSACAEEHATLMKIKNEFNIPIYGILYKDNAEDAKRWLANKGNPYVMVGDDANGALSIDLGIFGTPETYVIGPDGKIVYRQIGIITLELWQNSLYPLIRKLGEINKP